MTHRVVSVVACGPSALLCGAADAPGHVIAVNDAFLSVRHDRVISMDGRWSMHRVPAHFAGTEWPPLHLRRSAFDKVPNNKHEDYKHIRTFDCDWQSAAFGKHIYQLNGPNSGYCALNLAYVMRPELVVLYGFDHAGGHFHAESEWRQRGEGCANSDAKFKVWVGACKTARQMFDARNIRVINTNPESRIRAFEFGRP